MRQVAHRGEWQNRFYESALAAHQLHYNHHPLGPRLHRALLDLYAAELTADTPEALVAACQRKTLCVIPATEPLPPLSELRELHARGVDLVSHLDQRAGRG